MRGRTRGKKGVRVEMGIRVMERDEREEINDWSGRGDEGKGSE